MKRRLLGLLLFVLVIAACGPRYSVVQAGSEYSGPVPTVIIRVGIVRQSPHFKEYSPKIRIFNSGSKPLVVTSIDFVAGGVTYHSTGQLGVLQTVGAKSEAELHARFALNSEIGDALKQPGELRFRYRGAQDGSAKIIVEGK
jgi:hypothetical protein